MPGRDHTGSHGFGPATGRGLSRAEGYGNDRGFGFFQQNRINGNSHLIGIINEIISLQKNWTI